MFNLGYSGRPFNKPSERNALHRALPAIPVLHIAVKTSGKGTGI